MANITSNLEEEYIATTVELRAKACLNTFQVNHVLARHAVKHFFQKKQYFVPFFQIRFGSSTTKCIIIKLDIKDDY